jgi:hypothetical protein
MPSAKKVERVVKKITEESEPEVMSEENSIEQSEEVVEEKPVAKKAKVTKPKSVKKKVTKKVSALKKKVGKSVRRVAKKKPVRKTKRVTKKKVAKKAKKPRINLTDSKKPRFFKLIEDDGVNSKGRFSGLKPKQAANKALTSLIKAMEKDGKNAIGVDIHFTLKECTRWNTMKYKKGSKDEKTGKPKKIEKKFHYIGKRELLDKEIIVDHVQETTDEKILTKGKNVKEVVVSDTVTKYYMTVKGEKGDKSIVVKKVTVVDSETEKPTVKYLIINEIKYKYTNKVQKEKDVSDEEPKKEKKPAKGDAKKVVKKSVKPKEKKEEKKVEKEEKKIEKVEKEEKVEEVKEKKPVAPKGKKPVKATKAK